MPISRIELQGTVARAQDFTTIKHNEDNKGAMAQVSIQKQNSEETEQKLQQVNKSDETKQQDKRFDAKDKSDNQYAGDGGKKRKRKEENPDGKVIIKGQARFDMKI